MFYIEHYSHHSDIVLTNDNPFAILSPKGDSTMTTIQFRVDEAIKAQSNAVFNQLGITMSDAINMFLRQAVLRGGIPFEITLPRYNETTLAALTDMEASKGKNIPGKEINAALADLKSDIDE